MGGLTVIIGLVSVQVTLKLELPTGTELGNYDTKNDDSVKEAPAYCRSSLDGLQNVILSSCEVL